MSSDLDSAGEPRVSAVIVSHDGERWLPHLISGLQALTRLPHRIIAVDTGSVDGSRELLASTWGAGRVTDAPVSSGFGAAVQHGLDVLGQDEAAGTDNEWIWLLHDDCTPAPDALAALLDVVAADPGVSVVGCRVRAWPRARRLLEVGVTITGTGHRETGLEPGEYDQGQHDGVRSVLAVSSAGLLVRRSLWDQLGGFDRRLPLFRDDVDFGWRVARAGGRVVVSPDAIVFHAEAATRGVRAIANTVPSPHRADRRAALFTLLANCRTLAFPWQYVRLFLGSLIRAIGYLLGKLPGAAYDELAAMVAVLLRPDRIIAARARRRQHWTAPRSAVRPLLPAWWTPYLNGVDSMLSRFADSVRETATSVATSARNLRARQGSVDSGPVSEEAELEPVGAGPVAWVLTHPILCLLGVFTLAGMIASRGLWGGGDLQGGALLPAPGAATDWWRLYTESWHPIALGSDQATSPYVAMLAGAATILAGKAWLAVDVLMLFAVPLSSVGAYVLARRLVEHVTARVWMAASYALLPVLTGVATSGHIGTVVATIMLPWLVRAVLPLFAAESPAWRPVFAAGLVLAVIAAFCPLAWVMAAGLAVIALPWVFARRAPRTALYLVILLALPIALLAPWSGRFFSDSGKALFWREAGAIDPSTSPIAGHAWQLPFGRLAAAGDAPWWLTLGFVLAAVVALLRADRRGQVVVAWVVLAVGLVTAMLVSREVVSAGTELRAYAWAGFPVVVAQGAAIVAAGLAADGVTRFIQSGAFGWRQPLAAATSVIALVAPLAGLVWWVGAAPHGELERTTDSTLPAYLVDTMRSDAQQRVLVVRGDATRVTYDVLLDDGVRLGDDSVDPRTGSAALDGLLADILSAGQPGDAARLADQGIGFVMLPAPADEDLVLALDGLPGLTRASTDLETLVGWKVDLPTGLARLADADADADADAATAGGSADAKVLPSLSGDVEATIPAGTASRTITLAVSPDDGFAARLNGKDLERAAGAGTGAQFSVGAAAGNLEAGPTGHRDWWLLGQAAAWLVALVLATPAATRRSGIAEVDA